MNITHNEKTIKEILMRQDETFKTLDQEHREFDRKLRELNNRNIKTDHDLIEERNLKKRKLQIKDSMQKYIFEYKKGMM